MSGWTIAGIAYAFTTLGFCLGFVACAVFARPAPPTPTRRRTDPGYQPLPTAAGPVMPPPQRP